MQLRAAGAPKGRVKHAPDTIQGGYAAARALLEADPTLTAIFATNDLPALGAMHAAADLGLNVPGDLSVIGITDIQLARESRPALTTVAVPTVEVAGLAVIAVARVDRIVVWASGSPGSRQACRCGFPPRRSWLCAHQPGRRVRRVE